MTRIVTRRRRVEPEQEPDAPGTPSWINSEEGRRITFLELVAWAVIQAESCSTQEEWNVFQAELTANRKQHWLDPRPWSRATDPEEFKRHVLAFSDAWVTNGRYPARRERPRGEE